MSRLFSLFLALIIGASAALATNRALLIGIGSYDRMATGWGPTHGDRDVDLLLPVLQKRGFTDIVTLKNERARKSAVVQAFKDLADRCAAGDKVYIHFSGHGQLVVDANGDEGTPKPYDEALVLYDAGRDSRKLGGAYDGRNHLIDDEIAPLLSAIKKKIGRKGEIFFAADACYSRGIQKDEITELDDTELLNYIRGTDHPFYPPAGSKYLASLPKPRPFPAGGKLYVATGAQGNERNLEYRAPDGKIYGSLSYYVDLLLRKDADFARWAREFQSGAYTRTNIFPPFQHPSLTIIS